MDRNAACAVLLFHQSVFLLFTVWLAGVIVNPKAFMLCRVGGPVQLFLSFPDQSFTTCGRLVSSHKQLGRKKAIHERAGVQSQELLVVEKAILLGLHKMVTLTVVTTLSPSIAPTQSIAGAHKASPRTSARN